MPCTEVKLNIADTIITLRSIYPLKRLSKAKEQAQGPERFKDFLYSGSKKSDIFINVKIADKLPRPANAKDLFTTYHPEDGRENWRLLKKGRGYIYKTKLREKNQCIFVNGSFNRVRAHLLPKKNKRFVWDVDDIIYDFLQVLLIMYFAKRRAGIFVHSAGIKDLDGKGFIFAGKSGAGKSTTARIWHSHSKATVLNDDRVIVRNFNSKFYIYGAPWHGDFNDYISSYAQRASVDKLFFIYHSSKNTIKPISSREAFAFLYPAVFPTFWDSGCLQNIISFCQDLTKKVPCFNLGFVKNKNIIRAVRNL